MSRSPKIYLCLLTILLLSNCRKKEMEEYYDRPDWLAQPIYQQLASGQFGDFKLFLACIDKAGYNHVLDRAGYFTIFAPTDSAFQVFLNDNYSGSIDNIEAATARKIVTYTLIFNAFKKDRLDDYQSTSNGWDPDKAFKRRTAYYKGVYTDPSLPAPYNSYLLIDGNRKSVTGATTTNLAFDINDNGNKYIPYFTQSFMAYKGLSSFDYNYFYPETPFTGFNVASAKVLIGDIPAENGYIHVINKVIAPLPNIDEYITSTPDQYSRFKEILDSFIYVFSASPQMAAKYEKVTNVLQDVYVKRIDPSPAPVFSPNNENWSLSQANDAQTDGWTIFVPRNDALNDFITNKLCKYYGSLGRLPRQVIYDFMNSLMSENTIWPSQINSINNFLGESMIDIKEQIFDPKILSNGLFYGTSMVHHSDLFYTVFGEIYLNPRYSMMSTMLSTISVLNVDTKSALISPYSLYTVFLIPDSVFLSKGFSYDANTNTWYGYDDKGQSNYGTEIQKKLIRIVNMHIVKIEETELDLEDGGIAKSFGNEYIKFRNNQIYASGNIDTTGTVVDVINAKRLLDLQPSNGVVYEVDSIMEYTTSGIRGFIGGNPNYQMFYNRLKASTLFNSLDQLLGNGENMILIPTDSAINADPIASSTVKDEIDRFIKYHIIPKKSFLADGQGGGDASTWLQIGIEPSKVTISNLKNNLTITDETGNTATVYNDFIRSNVLANKTIIHQIDKVLQYIKK